MGQPAEPLHPRATYADVVAAPPDKVTELVDGILHVSPRPHPRHSEASTSLAGELLGPFRQGRGGPGGWRIHFEPELHLGPESNPDVLVPDLAGWRIERMPELPEEPYFRQPPDWVCEVLSPSTEAFDRVKKMRVYAREGVRFAWLINPLTRTLEVFILQEGRWFLAGVHEGGERVRAEPFEVIELNLSALWGE